MAGTIARISHVPVRVREVWNADTCPSNLLPWLAWAVSVDTWDSNWTDAQKRGAIRNSVGVHRYKGTIGAVKDAMAGLGYGVQIQEWFNQIPEGEPYTFAILLDSEQQGIAEADLQRLFALIESAKNLRSHLSEVQLQATSRCAVYVPSIAVMGHDITVEFVGNLVADGSAFADGEFIANGIKL